MGKFKSIGLIALGAVAGVLISLNLQAIAERAARAPLPLEELRAFAEVFGMIKQNYVEPVDEKKLITDAITGMVSGLDPHSPYFDKKTLQGIPQAARRATSSAWASRSAWKTAWSRCVSPIEDSPAFRAGIKPGDLITRIDDTPVKGLTLDQAVKRMRGEPNTKVTLTIFRKGETAALVVTLTREEIRVQSVRAKMIEPGYAWVRVSASSRTAPSTTSSRKLEELYKQDPTSRAWCSTCATTRAACSTRAVAISAAFLPDNAVVVSTNGRRWPNRRRTFKAAPEYYARRAAPTR